MTVLMQTPAEAGLSVATIIYIALDFMVDRGSAVDISEIYEAVELCMHGHGLSVQGQASIREIIGRTAVARGYVQQFDRRAPGWRITAIGRRHLNEERSRE